MPVNAGAITTTWSPLKTHPAGAWEQGDKVYALSLLKCCNVLSLAHGLGVCQPLPRVLDPSKCEVMVSILDPVFCSAHYFTNRLSGSCDLKL